MMALFDWTEEEKYKHIKHFIDTHPKYSESNVRYLKYWVDFFDDGDERIRTSMHTEPDMIVPPKESKSFWDQKPGDPPDGWEWVDDSLPRSIKEEEDAIQ